MLCIHSQWALGPEGGLKGGGGGLLCSGVGGGRVVIYHLSSPPPPFLWFGLFCDCSLFVCFIVLSSLCMDVLLISMIRGHWEMFCGPDQDELA